MSISIDIDLHIESGMNLREHWRTRHRRWTREKLMVAAALNGVNGKPKLPCIVTLTRLAPRKLDDDNNAMGMKAPRDAIARWLGVDDGGASVQWKYDQGKSSDYVLRVSFSEAQGE